MKFSEMKYERPDLDKVLAQCEEYAKKMAAAQSGEELVQLYREENAMMAPLPHGILPGIHPLYPGYPR